VRPPAPASEVTVEGLVVDPGSFDGTAPRDLEPLLAEGDTLPGLVLAESSVPPEPGGATPEAADPGSIVPVPPPELSEGPHLGYAAQWFIFSTIALVGYPIVLRRVVIRRGKEVDDDDPPAAPARRDDLDAELDELLRQGG
jgi:cytochrome oxidase assembly protein ShyY1